MIMQRAWQGRFDGFCGVYSACHALCFESDAYEADFETAFYAVLGALENRFKLTASKIAGPDAGYSDLELADAIAAVSARRRRSKLTMAFRDARFKKSDAYRNSDYVFRAGGALVVQEDGPRHWIAITGRADDLSYSVFDPNIHEPCQRRSRINWDQGLVIGPQNWIKKL